MKAFYFMFFFSGRYLVRGIFVASTQAFNFILSFLVQGLEESQNKIIQPPQQQQTS